MFELEFSSKAPTLTEPRFLIFYSKPKTGKTSSLMQLPNSLLIDLENSSDFFEGNGFNVIKKGIELTKHPITLLKELANKIKEANDTAGKAVYDFIVLDSATVLEDYATLLATKNYKNSVIGKSFTGHDVVKELANGAGYAFMREAFDELYEPFITLPGKCFILVVHTKDTVVNREGKDMSTTDLNLTGKAKMITASKADGIGLIYRSKKEANLNILSFKQDDTNISIGCRLDYLRNQEFEISSIEDNKLKTNWEVIFPSLTTQKS
jgi:uncharacterized protein YozE (UPF0346 family)